jgi:uncharacterized spore protein YtfJ
MDVNELMTQARDAISVKRVFGEPIEREGVTVIPVARVMGGYGFGGGPAAGRREGTSPTDEPQYGAGSGLMAGPAGVYVIRGTEVDWEPAISVERLVLTSGFVAVLVLLVARSIVRVLVGR